MNFRKMTLSLLLLPFLFPGKKALSKDGYWDTQKKGTNFFNHKESSERLKSASESGLSWVRLTPSKWQPSGSKIRGDFLSATQTPFRSLAQEDIRNLKSFLDDAAKEKIGIVLTFLNLPGRTWSQHNNGVQDRRIWEELKWQEEAIQFWVALAKELKDHPAIVAYNIINEPSPEKSTVSVPDWQGQEYETWYQKIKGGPQDLNLFYKKVVEKIRTVDSKVWIMLDSGFYSTPWAFRILEPVDDPRVLYSFHMYEPFAYTFSHLRAKNGEKVFSYPGKIPVGETPTGEAAEFNREKLAEFLSPVRDWQKKHKLPPTRIVAGEFGVNRTAPGASTYFRDLISIFDAEGWHWAFYSYREDEWDAMDYELGAGKVRGNYWEAIDKGLIPDYRGYQSDFLKAVKDSLSKKS